MKVPKLKPKKQTNWQSDLKAAQQQFISANRPESKPSQVWMADVNKGHHDLISKIAELELRVHELEQKKLLNFMEAFQEFKRMVVEGQITFR